MSAVTTLAGILAAAAGGVALYRFMERRRRALKDILEDAKLRASGRRAEPVIDYERDPVSGVFRPKS